MQPLSENAFDDMLTRERERLDMPLTDWDSLSARLRAEGLIREPSSRFSAVPLARIAAALALTIGGIAAGRASAGAPVLPLTAQSSATAPPALPASESSAQPVTTDNRATLASSGAVPFSSPEQAWEVLNRAGEEYQRASAYLSERNNEAPLPPSTDQYRTRLAALDNVMSEMRDAMREAPEDPVINQYYLATVGAREATLRQLGTVLPASARMNRF